MKKDKIVEILKTVATHAITSELNPNELDNEGFEIFVTRIDSIYSGDMSEGVKCENCSSTNVIYFCNGAGFHCQICGYKWKQTHPVPEISDKDKIKMYLKRYPNIMMNGFNGADLRQAYFGGIDDTLSKRAKPLSEEVCEYCRKPSKPFYDSELKVEICPLCKTYWKSHPTIEISEDFKDKIKTLIGYLKIWNRSGRMCFPPPELNGVIEEADVWIKELNKQ